MAQFASGQTSGSVKLVGAEAAAPEPSANSYTVLGATAKQEALVRAQIRVMQPDVYPLRVLFVPHWNYIDTTRTFRLHVPAGYTSAMFTHLPSRSVFIDSDRSVSDDSLGYWVAHELGHLAANSASEADADKVAREYRKRLRMHINQTYIEAAQTEHSGRTVLVRPHHVNNDLTRSPATDCCECSEPLLVSRIGFTADLARFNPR